MLVLALLLALVGAAPAWTVADDSLNDLISARGDQGPGVVALADRADRADTKQTVLTLLSKDFDTLRTGPVRTSGLGRALGRRGVPAAVLDDTSVVHHGSGSALRVTLRDGTVHSLPRGNNGLNIFVPLNRVVANACVSYDVRFDQDFDWSLGGKLPGLLGVAPDVSPSVPTGGGSTTSKGKSVGWSGRMMWLGPGAIRMPGRDNMAVSYMYSPHQKTKYGDNVRWNASFDRGSWHTVKQCYQMNTVGQRDGVLQAWMDGHLVVSRSDFVYRDRQDVGISHLALSVFRGGHTKAWAGDRTDTIDFDNLHVTTVSP